MRMPSRVVRYWLLGSFVAIAALSTPGCNSRSQSIQPFVSSCKTDGEIPERDLAAADKAAIEFVQNALGPNPETAYSNFTADARGSVTSEKFVAMFRQGIQRMGPFKDLRAAHTYLAQLTGGTQEQRVVCGNLSSPEVWVAVTAKPGPAQAHVIVEAQTLNNTWAFVTWLLPEQGNWHVQYTQATTTAMVGKDAQDLGTWPSPRPRRITTSMLTSYMQPLHSEVLFFNSEFSRRFKRTSPI